MLQQLQERDSEISRLRLLLEGVYKEKESFLISQLQATTAIERLQSESSDLRQELAHQAQAHANSFSELKRVCSDFESANQSLRTQVNELTASLATAVAQERATKAGPKQDMPQLHNRQHALESERSTHLARIAQLEQQVTDLTREKLELQEGQIALVQRAATAESESHVAAQQARDAVTQATATQHEHLTYVQEAERVQEALRQSISQLEAEKNAALQALDSLRSEHAQTLEHYSELQASNQRLEHSLADLTADRARLETEVATVRQQLDQAQQRERAERDSTAHSSQQLSAQMQQVLIDFEQERRHSASLQQQIATLHTDLTAAQSSLATLQQHANVLEQQLEAKSAEYALLESSSRQQYSQLQASSELQLSDLGTRNAALQ